MDLSSQDSMLSHSVQEPFAGSRMAKVAVVGSRGFDDYTALVEQLDALEIDMIVSGGAAGADSLAERYAAEHGIPTRIHLPDWKRYGRSAGVQRNRLIVEDADIVLAFWDGVSKGTASTIRLAQKAGKRLIVVRTDTASDQLVPAAPHPSGSDSV